MDSIIITVGISIGIAFMLFLVVYVLFYEKIEIWYYRNKYYSEYRDDRLREIARHEAYTQESNNWNKRHHIEDKLNIDDEISAIALIEGERDWILKYLEAYNFSKDVLDEIISRIEFRCFTDSWCGGRIIKNDSNICTVDAVVQEVLEEIEEKRLRQEFNRYLIDRYLTEDDCKWDKHEITYYNIK